MIVRLMFELSLNLLVGIEFFNVACRLLVVVFGIVFFILIVRR